MIENNILFSVIVPCYNAGHVLERSLGSVINQSGIDPSSLEIIVIDDNSVDRDEIEKVIHAFNDERITLLQLSVNSGASAARNKGIDFATGKYICFLDADDSWHSQKLEIMMKYINNYPGASIYGHIVHHNRDLPGELNFGNNIPKPKHIDLLKLISKNYFLTPSVMIKSDSIQRFDESMKLAEDLDLWIRLTYKYGSGIFVPIILGRTYKPAFGVSGLSSNIIAMVSSENHMYSKLYGDKIINIPLLVFAKVILRFKLARRYFSVIKRRKN